MEIGVLPRTLDGSSPRSNSAREAPVLVTRKMVARAVGAAAAQGTAARGAREIKRRRRRPRKGMRCPPGPGAHAPAGGEAWGRLASSRDLPLIRRGKRPEKRGTRSPRRRGHHAMPGAGPGRRRNLPPCDGASRNNSSAASVYSFSSPGRGTRRGQLAGLGSLRLCVRERAATGLGLQVLSWAKKAGTKRVPAWHGRVRSR